MPSPLISFLSSLIKNGQYIADGFLTDLELQMISLDAYGRIISISEEQVKIVIGTLLIIKVLVGKMLLSPKSSGIIAPHN